MKENKIEVVVIDTDAKTIYPSQIENNLKTFYQVLKCSCIDIVTREFAGVSLDVILDDEGLLDPDKAKRPAIITTDRKGERVLEQLVGNCIICAHDDEGETISLTSEQMKAVSKCVFLFHNGQMGLIAHV